MRDSNSTFLNCRPAPWSAPALGATREDIYKQAKPLDVGPIPMGQRLRFVVLAGELKGPDEALDRLDSLKEQLDKGEIPPTGPDEVRQAQETITILDRLYRDYKAGDRSAPHVGEEDRQTLQQRLGWFGDLALNLRQGPNPAARAAVLAPAERSFLADGVVMVAVVGAGVVGFILLVLFLALWQWMHSRITTGSPYGGVYAETFALWLIVYFGLGRASEFLLAGLPLALVYGLPQLLSLSVLAWPVLPRRRGDRCGPTSAGGRAIGRPWNRSAASSAIWRRCRW